MRYVALLPRWVHELYCPTTYCRGIERNKKTSNTGRNLCFINARVLPKLSSEVHLAKLTWLAIPVMQW